MERTMGEERRRYGSAREWVYHELRSRIVSGEIVGGHQLRSKPLTEQFGVSVSPLREAIHQLAANGFVDLSPQRGARVTVVAKGDLGSLYDARQLIEPEAARRSVTATDQAHAEAVGVAFDRLPRAQPKAAAGRTALAHAEEAFLLAVVQRCSNPWLLGALETLRIHTIRARAVAAGPADVSAVRGALLAIHDAVVAASPDEAARLVGELLAERARSAAVATAA